TRLSLHFVSTVDKANLQDVLNKIDPEKALFLISSKSFSTIETLTNAKTAINWMCEKLKCDSATILKKHFIAITASQEKAQHFGIPVDHILPLWDWVGGRYSIWSAIGFPLLLLLQEAQYQQFLHGAYLMDEHFQYANFNENMPILLSALSIWYTNFFQSNAQAIIPYSHRLRYLVPYLQQATMESNGKSMRL